MLEMLVKKIKENCVNINMDMVNKAFNLAFEAHKEQKRDSGEPYIIHPIEVATILAELGMDTSTIVAGLLHDVIEDTEYTYDDIKNIFSDEVFINKVINDVSQTMYGQVQIDLAGYKSLGVTSMGLDNFQKIIKENGNPKDVVIATIGYGVNVQNEIFKDRLTENYYNFMSNNNKIQETVEQGSRIAEVLVDSTTSNVKLMPLVVVDKDGYYSTSNIIRAIAYSVKNADVACYELVNEENKAINLSLEKAFKENLPICVVSSNEDVYPANNGMTIAVSSLDRELKITDYSSKGDFIDFAASSTDVAEIFNQNATVSRWSGPRIF